MTHNSGPAHCAAILIEASATRAFDFLADPLQLGTWSLGCMNTRQVSADGLYMGHSLYDDAPAHFKIHAVRDLLLIDYWVGPADRLVPRISARVMPGKTNDLDAERCYVSLMAWRSARMSDAKWQQLCTAHEAEVWLLKARIEGVVPK